MVYGSHYSIFNNNSSSINKPQGAGKTALVTSGRFSGIKMSSLFRAATAMRIMIIGCTILTSLFVGMIIHALTGGDEVQAASLQVIKSSYESNSGAVQLHASTNKHIIVLDGDSLWTIAKQYMPNGLDIRAYIDKIQQVNHLSSSHIQSGQILVLPN